MSDGAAHTLSGDQHLALPEFDAPPPEPLGLLSRWLHEAVERGVREPHATTLSTVDAHGRPSARTVLARPDARGLVFGTSANSRKGVDLAANPYAAAALYWRETGQQITVHGPVEKLPDAEADHLFARRTRDARAASATSRQGEPLDDVGTLIERARSLSGSDGPIGRPAWWAAYLLRPEIVEFWHGSVDRLHRRLEYRRDGQGWTHRRLQP